MSDSRSPSVLPVLHVAVTPLPQLNKISRGIPVFRLDVSSSDL